MACRRLLLPLSHAWQAVSPASDHPHRPTLPQARKQLSHNSIVSEVTRQLAVRFIPNQQVARRESGMEGTLHGDRGSGFLAHLASPPQLLYWRVQHQLKTCNAEPPAPSFTGDQEADREPH